ncbi:MAG: peptide ABC transporter substrate-binding protein [Clostridia bacterium]|nr:peptide ABC transporter substrate-binding protein [Clostridia bacterium]
MRKFCSLLILMTTILLTMTSCKLPVDSVKSGKQEVKHEDVNDNDDIMDMGPVKGGTVNLFTTNPDTLNPVLSNNIYVQDFCKLIFEGLVKLDENQKPIPKLADRWDISTDGLTWTFHLRDNVFWHNKMPFTAEDVEFTMATIINAKSNSIYKKNLDNITTFGAIDRSNFRIVLKRPYSFTAELMSFPIIPKHYYVNEDVFKLDSQRNITPVGTGPYKFLSRSDKDGIKLTTSDNWWGLRAADEKMNDAPYIAEVNVKVYPTANDGINAFQARDVDIVPISNDDYLKYAGRSDLSIRKYASKKYEYIAFNLSNAILSDKIVRQAVAYAVNKSELVDDLLPGEAVITDLPVIPDTWLYDTNVISYTPSASKARELLLANGWKEQKDTTYKNIKGINVPLKFELLVNEDNQVRIKVAEAIKKQLEEAGVKLEIKKMGWDELFKRVRSRKFDMVFMGNTVTSIPDISFAYSSAEIATGFNVSGYKNPSVDSYLQQILVENDTTRKKALFINMKNIITDEVPYIGLYFYNDAVLYNKKIKGELKPYIWDRYHDITQWYIPNR